MDYWILHILPLSALLLTQCAQFTQGSVTLEAKMISFRNSNKRDERGEPCDGKWGIHLSNCDHRLLFCFDQLNGDQNNPDSCAYSRAETGEFGENSELQFDHDMQGVPNPIIHKMDNWPGGVLLKILATDDDSPISGADRVDTYAIKFQNDPARTKAEAVTTTQVYNGRRTRTTATSLTVEWKVYCDKDYYGSICAVHCVAQDSDAGGHYTCHPDTGAIVCRPGWESTPDLCKIKANDCDPNPCLNGATCVDGNRTYSCVCKDGYSGIHCETDINECASGPCQNNGTCEDLVGSYKCQCAKAYSGGNCQHHICDVAPCLNGGTCYDDGKCLCQPEYTGRYCQSAICNGVTCENNGTCSNGICHCLPGFVGQRCDVNVCDFHECHNNGTCLPEKRCACIPGWTGIHCEFPISDCDNVTCFNGGVCYEFQGQTLCHCPLNYEGTFCERFLPPEVIVGRPPSTLKENEDTNFGNKVGKVVYTEPRDDKGLIIGLIIGGFAILVIAIIVLAMRRRRRLKQTNENTQTQGEDSYTNPVYAAQNDSVSLGIGTDAGTQDPVNVSDRGTQAGGAVGGAVNPEKSSKDIDSVAYFPYPIEDPPAYYAELPPLPEYSPGSAGGYAEAGEGVYDRPRGMTSYDVPSHLRSNPPEGATGFDEPIYEMPGPAKSVPVAEVSRPEQNPKNFVLPKLPESKK